MTKRQLPNQQTVANMILSINILNQLPAPPSVNDWGNLNGNAYIWKIPAKKLTATGHIFISGSKNVSSLSSDSETMETRFSNVGDMRDNPR